MIDTSGRTPQSSKLMIAASLGVGFIVALILAEIAVRIVMPHPAHFRGHPANVPGLVTAHPERGYTWTPGFEGKMESADFSNDYVISSQGLRDDFIVDIGARRVLAVGDSFTGGEGVDAHETWPKQLENLINQGASDRRTTQVINAGVTGYGARQMRQMAEELAPVFNPARVIMGIYANGYDRVERPYTLVGVHLVREDYASEMRVLASGDIFWHQTEFENPTVASFEVWTQNYWHFAAYVIKVIHKLRRTLQESVARPADIIPAADRLAAVFEELLKLKSFLQSQNIALTVLVISQQNPDGTFVENNKIIAAALQEFCLANGIDLIDPTAALEARAKGRPIYRFENDGHWTAAAHRAVAEEIVVTMRRVD